MCTPDMRRWWLTTPALATMDIDDNVKQPKSKLKGRIVKRRGRKSGIVFPKYGDRNKVKKRK